MYCRKLTFFLFYVGYGCAASRSRWYGSRCDNKERNAPSKGCVITSRFAVATLCMYAWHCHCVQLTPCRFHTRSYTTWYKPKRSSDRSASSSEVLSKGRIRPGIPVRQTLNRRTENLAVAKGVSCLSCCSLCWFVPHFRCPHKGEAIPFFGSSAVFHTPCVQPLLYYSP